VGGTSAARALPGRIAGRPGPARGLQPSVLGVSSGARRWERRRSHRGRDRARRCRRAAALFSLR